MTPGATDPSKGIKQAIDQELKTIAGEAITVWHSEAQDRLTEAAEQRSGLDAQRDQRGSLEGRENNALHAITQSFTAPHWDEQGGFWEFSVAHPGAVFAEWGAAPHDIQRSEAESLAFTWPDAPEDVREKFNFDDPTADDYQMVFYDNVDHPGMPAIGYLRYGRDQAQSRLEDAGYGGEFEMGATDPSGGGA